VNGTSGGKVSIGGGDGLGHFRDGFACLGADRVNDAYVTRFDVAGATCKPRDPVTEWLHDLAMTAGTPVPQRDVSGDPGGG